MTYKLLKCSWALVATIMFLNNSTSAGLITGGQASVDLDVSLLSTPSGNFTFERFYGAPGDEAATLSRNEMVEPAGPPHPDSPTNSVDLIHPVNGTVTSPNPPGGGIRFRQSTTLDYDPLDVLGSWAASSFNGFNVLNDGEQIGLDGVTRLAVDPGLGGGTFLFGDLGLRYAPTRPTPGNGLVIVSNFDFQNSPLFDIGNATITADDTTLTITGDLLLAAEYTFFFGGVAGSDVGDFELVATVPEPSTIVLLLTGLVAMGACLRHRG